MQRRRGLVSGPTPVSTNRYPLTSSSAKRDRSSCSSSEDSSHYDEGARASNAINSDFKDKESPSHGRAEQEDTKNHVDVSTEDGNNHTKPSDKRSKKTKRDMSDETRWQKMKVVGSEQEVMVDLTRVQKYVDYDSSTVQAFQSEVQSAKGNYRQQALADYSDL